MKKSLIIALALMLVLAFASSAMAAQALSNGQYLSTATGVYYSTTTLQNVYKNHVPGQYVADGVTNYPYEIYIPNELSPGSYRIHSSYAKNTDACASCHSTHTALGNTLLQWYSTYETCMACHDGTVTTTYNVEKGEYVTKNAKTFNAMGGEFGGTAADFASNHNVTGALSISAAPGGSTSGTDTFGGKRWTPTFGCESCHTPHGNGGNARILHPDANYTATRAASSNGYAVVTGCVYDLKDTGYTTPLYILKGYPAVVSFKNAGVDVPATAASIDNSRGYSIVTGTVDVVYGIPALQVKIAIDNYLSYADANTAETVQHVSGMNAFCGACHTDYNTKAFIASNSSDNLTGEYTQAHRHQVGVPPLYNNPANGNKNNLPAAKMVLESGNLECLTCHVAHGVNADFWKKTVGSTGSAYLADADLVELAGSSALKRLPNMGTCEACHQKGASAEGYAIPALGSDKGTQTDGGQSSASYVGMNSAAPCAACHIEAVEKFIETQHAYLVSPLEAGKYFTAFTEDGKGNATQEAIDALATFESEIYPQLVAGMPVNELAGAQPLTAAVLASKSNVLSAGQLPIGKKTTAAREIVVKTNDGSKNVYSVVATADYENGEWLITGWELNSTSGKVQVTDNYTGCVRCHSVAKNNLANNNAPARALLDGWTAYFANPANGKPSSDLSLSCEACHGEASNHVKAPMNANIFNPGKADTKVQSRVCGRCHVASGDKGLLTAYYSPWKLVDNTPVPAGVVTGTANGTTSSIAYNTVAGRLAAIFKGFYEAPLRGTLPAVTLPSSSTSATDYTYKTAEGRAWDGPNHSQYTQYTISYHFDNPDLKLSCATCHDAHSEEIDAAQTKVTPAILCQTCHGTDITPAKYMPSVWNSGVRYHDFGTVINPVTQKFYNTSILHDPLYN